MIKVQKNVLNLLFSSKINFYNKFTKKDHIFLHKKYKKNNSKNNLPLLKIRHQFFNILKKKKNKLNMIHTFAYFFFSPLHNFFKFFNFNLKCAYNTQLTIISNEQKFFLNNISQDPINELTQTNLSIIANYFYFYFYFFIKKLNLIFLKKNILLKFLFFFFFK